MFFDNVSESSKKTPVIAVVAFVSSLLIPLTFGMTFAPAILCGLGALCKTFPNENTKRKNRLATSALGISFLFIVAIVLFMVYMFLNWSHIETSLVDQNMQKVGRAMLAFHGDKGCFPLYMTEQDSQGNYPHSWRVQILPYLGETALYRQIHLNEPWDSPWNRQFHNRMPAIFKNPNRKLPTGFTTYSVITGKETLFSANQSCSLEDVTKKIDDVLLIVERTPVCWMNPEADIPTEKCFPIGSPSGIIEAECCQSLKIKAFQVVTCSGNYYVLPSDIGEYDFRSLVHKDQIPLRAPLENFYYRWQQYGSEHFTIIQNIPGCKKAESYSSK